jgi:hypothetical protein
MVTCSIFINVCLTFRLSIFYHFKGMRIVQGPDEFADSVLSAQREAAASFGVNTLLIEKYITQPRHVEVQVTIGALSSVTVFFFVHCVSAVNLCCLSWSYFDISRYLATNMEM